MKNNQLTGRVDSPLSWVPFCLAGNDPVPTVRRLGGTFGRANGQASDASFHLCESFPKSLGLASCILAILFFISFV